MESILTYLDVMCPNILYGGREEQIFGSVFYVQGMFMKIYKIKKVNRVLQTDDN